ncbi:MULTISPECIES: SPOR domain-containing protein [Stenotrophomonas]|jgi:cell division protein FtsN|uniref:Sporulation protein n=1 Tax=Stenotrophomonas maltophilia TaxID=40324 RepID=A0A4S2CT74_STEMA|nr:MULTISPECIES: SPOR domain-containing protein [Stenotrophomonas]MBD3825537.1 SPOR domain-containing protein [Stenotrophomonas sp.]QIO86651.1 sporulation protein [Stenotrophomonas rhizophila]TGY32019.1 sporulation protein [Stenotrophomonas maltophilia]
MAARRGKSQARRNSNQGTPGWVWLVAGVAIAAVVFLAAPNLFKSDGDGFLRVGPQPNPAAQPAPVSDAETDVGSELPKPGAAKPAEPAKPPATQYDFYTLLPGKEVEMSDAELAASARAEDQRRAKAEAQRAQAALEGRPVPAAPATTTASPAAAAVATTAPATTSPAPLPAPVSERPAASTAPATAPAPVASTTPAAPKPTATAPATAAAEPANSNVRYILQAGAFGASGDAEATKAKLAMIGLAARVESAQINGKTVYRVRMGPYGSAGELAEAKQKLDGTGLQAMAIKAQ